MKNFPWWQEGVIYQIYPRSFSDSNGDGLGDLGGIFARLDYLAKLGIDAIWISPFFPTPDKDFGYDITNHVDVDPRFGNLETFDRLVAEAHHRDIHVILDLVLNHTSDQHPWFLESRSSRDNPRRDWYIWKDKPNNWQSWFGGPAWEVDPITKAYYLHIFAKEQPDVNWQNPELRKAQLDVFRFWLERGVDGFRLDVFNAYFKHPDLPDNPPKFGLRGFDKLGHIHDMDQPELIPFLQELRALVDSYPERYLVGETYLSTLEKVISYCGPDKLHAAFSFDFTFMQLIFPWNPRWIMKQVNKREQKFNEAGIWPTTVMSNHDLPRAASRYGRGEDDFKPMLAMTLLLTLRGTPYIYYGEEIGMRNIHLSRSEILDPVGKKYWPVYKSRDLCRAPMQWDDSAFAGFSTTKPWLPVHPNYKERNVLLQETNPGSIFNFTKNLIALRKDNPALRHGGFVPLTTMRTALVFLRQTVEQTVLVGLNFNGRKVKYPLPEGTWRVLLTTAAGTPGNLSGHEIQLLIKE
jgi:alpha-glucosidase